MSYELRGPNYRREAVPTVDSPMREKSFDFALRVIRLYGELRGARGYLLSRQLLRSGTNIGAEAKPITQSS